MSSDIGGHKSNAALYQYGVPLAVFSFAAICTTIYFRMSLLADRRQRQLADAERDGTRGEEDMDLRIHPIFFETYLADGWWDPSLQSGVAIPSVKEWDQITPLSVLDLDSSAASTATKGDIPDADPGTANSNTDYAGSRLLVSVVICMPRAPALRPQTSPTPSATTNGQEGEQETDAKSEPLPSLELGLVEVDVSRIGDGGSVAIKS
ncbi:hypothetical protein B0H16DRAFT_1509670 [Mycena metata]|uniref:Uncharacterized protein n=1 Tax=Mycena metata TaxID=1033252 RepID=A0AAD7JZG8_9AGAR|nr:hypothetical protein B0H16DRAFT_1509670 [Mycena metata]